MVHSSLRDLSFKPGCYEISWTYGQLSTVLGPSVCTIEGSCILENRSTNFELLREYFLIISPNLSRISIISDWSSRIDGPNFKSFLSYFPSPCFLVHLLGDSSAASPTSSAGLLSYQF